MRAQAYSAPIHAFWLQFLTSDSHLKASKFEFEAYTEKPYSIDHRSVQIVGRVRQERGTPFVSNSQAALQLQQARLGKEKGLKLIMS